jgi:hypothetical protein
MHSQDCASIRQIFLRNHADRYISLTDEPPEITSAAMYLENLKYNEFLGQLNSNFKRNVKKSYNHKFEFDFFNYSNYVPDIYDINTSLDTRNGRKMSANYSRTIEELGGEPSEFYAHRPLSCPLHGDLWCGIFLQLEDHYQGEVLVDKKLVAYVRLRRNGDFCFYSLILGHGGYLKYGIMHLLHVSIVEYLLLESSFKIKWLIYAGAFQGKDGLQRWKKEAKFKPTNLYHG